MEIRVVISGYQSVERTRAENGLIAPFTMVEGNSSSIIQENTVGGEGVGLLKLQWPYRHFLE